jgi:hypothetical protein
MSRTRPDSYILQDRRTRMYWCDGLRDERKRGWHLLRVAATSYGTRTHAARSLNGIQCDAIMRARIEIVPVYEAATPPIEVVQAAAC